MISVAEARARILSAFATLPVERVTLAEARDRVLAESLAARLTQPPADLSAMDGYAVRAADVAALPARLRVIESIAAGAAPTRPLETGEAARIFTGAPVPDGADLVVIQENCAREDDSVIVREGSCRPGQHIRKAGSDFRSGEILLPAGTWLEARHLALAAAMNWPCLPLTRRPRIALLSTGDELVRPGATPGRGQIVASNGSGLAAFVAANGGEPMDLGIVPDDRAAIGGAIERARGCDLLVTSGGASVGERDLVQAVMRERGLALDFWKIAMRPGKPVLFGASPDLKLLGLPGNPVSALVTALLFLGPAIRRMIGVADPGPRRSQARLAHDLKGNDVREDYLRATLMQDEDGIARATILPLQDSSHLSALARADALVIRPPLAAPAQAGDWVDILPLADQL